MTLGGEIARVIEQHADRDLLPGVRRVEMARALESFVRAAIDKYYQGQQAHGGDIVDRNLSVELRQEQIDQFWYLEAMKWRKAHHGATDSGNRDVQGNDKAD